MEGRLNSCGMHSSKTIGGTMGFPTLMQSCEGLSSINTPFRAKLFYDTTSVKKYSVGLKENALEDAYLSFKNGRRLYGK